jgi:GNAT superfamily N-acetyltransferase
MFVREATPEELSDVLGICNGSALDVDRDSVTSRIERGDTLVAVSDDGNRVLGTLILDGDYIEAIAVRRRRRGQGIGTALIETATQPSLTAEFDHGVKPFYEHLGFRIESTESGRYRGTIDRST